MLVISKSITKSIYVYVLIALFLIPTASWEKPVLIATLVLAVVVVLVIASLCWYRYRKRLRERQKVNEEEIETWRQESAPRGRGQRKEESREHQENLKYSRLKCVGSRKDSAEYGKTGEVMV